MTTFWNFKQYPSEFESLHDFMNFELGAVMGFGTPDSWLPNRETTIAVCTTVMAALVALYVYRSITQRTYHSRTRHVANEVELVRLCEEIREEPLSTLDRNIRHLVNSDSTIPGPSSFYYKNESVEISALVSASRYGRVDIVKYFLHNFSKCIQVTHTSNLDLPVGRYHSMREIHKCSALYAACFNGSIETVTHLLKAKANINQRDCLGRTPLQVACQRGHMMLVQELLSNGAKVNSSDNCGYTALLSAVSERHANVVTVLLEHNADIRHSSFDGHTALHIAAEDGSKQIVELLLQHDPKLACLHSYDQKHKLASPLYLAASRGHISITKLLMDASTRSATQVPDILLLWGAALVKPQHQYVRASVQRYWIEALELKEQHSLITSSLAPLEFYEYRYEMSHIDDVIGYFSSQMSTPNHPHNTITPTKQNGGINFAELGSDKSISLSSDGYIEVFYQSLIILERCLGYGDPLVIKRLLEVAKYMLSKRKYLQSETLLCRALEMSMDRTSQFPKNNFCHNSEMEYELKVMLKNLCDVISELLQNNYTELRFSVYLNYISTAFEGYVGKARYDCYNNPAKINDHVILLMLAVLAAWVSYREQIFDPNDTGIDYSEYDECENLAQKLINEHLFVCNGTTLLHLTLGKLGTRDSLVRDYPFLKDLSGFVEALLTWGTDDIVNLSNESGDKPLHIAACRARSDLEASQLILPLLSHCAHQDAVNSIGKTAAEIQRHQPLKLNSPMNLRCFCYNVIVNESLPYETWSLKKYFTEHDKVLLRLHDPQCAKIQFNEFNTRL